MLLIHNDDLSEITLEFSDNVESLNDIFKNTNITKTPKMIIGRGIKKMTTAFGYCSYLKTISERLFVNCPNVTSFSACFRNCNLTTIPERLFVNCPNVTSFSACFMEDRYLKSIPANLFANNPNVTNFLRCFYYCDDLTTIPERLFANNPNVTSFNECFYWCEALPTIPENLFANCPNVTNFTRCFFGCSGVTSKIPEVWKTHTKVTEHEYYAWKCEKAANYSSIPSGWK